MSRCFRALFCCAGFAIGLGGAAASAATITTGSLFSSGVALDLGGATPCGGSGPFASNVGTFTGSGPDGSGTASCGERDTVQVKTDATPHAYGRFNPEGGPWLDSNDLERVTWTVDIGRAARGVSFALTDAHDQPRSYFRIKVDGATWDIPAREANGTLHLVKILFDTPVETATITFRTRHNDGWGIAETKVAPVPLPAAWLLAGSSLGLLAAVRRRRRGRPA